MIVRDRLFEKLFIVGTRGATLASKFLLLLALTFYLELRDVGLYGMVLAVSVVYSHLGGLGVGANLARRVILGAKRRNSVIFAKQFTCYSIFFLFVIFVVIFVFFVGELELQISGFALSMSLFICFLELLSGEISRLFLVSGGVAKANALLFFRGGFWVFLLVACFYSFPALRKFEFVLFFWFVGCLLSLVLGIFWLIRDLISLRMFFFSVFSGPLTKYFYLVKNSLFVFAALSLNAFVIYVDRFLLASMMGIESVGIYTYYWSFLNALLVLVSSSILQARHPDLLKSKDNEVAFFVVAKEVYFGIAKSLSIIGPIIFLIVFFISNHMSSPQIRSEFHLFFPMLVVGGLRAFGEAAFFFVYARGWDFRLFIGMLILSLFSLTISYFSIYVHGLQGVLFGLAFQSLFMILIFSLLGGRRNR